jgi:uncharacterized protein YcfJ
MRKVVTLLSAAALVVPGILLTASEAEARGYNCRRGNNTVGMILGGVGGALLGRSVDRGRSRTTGTVIGAGAGALLGREIQRGRRCR